LDLSQFIAVRNGTPAGSVTPWYFSGWSVTTVTRFAPSAVTLPAIWTTE